jgi:hypothetical protein
MAELRRIRIKTRSKNIRQENQDFEPIKAEPIEEDHELFTTCALHRRLRISDDRTRQSEENQHFWTERNHCSHAKRISEHRKSNRGKLTINCRTQSSSKFVYVFVTDTTNKTNTTSKTYTTNQKAQQQDRHNEQDSQLETLRSQFLKRTWWHSHSQQALPTSIQ